MYIMIEAKKEEGVKDARRDGWVGFFFKWLH